MRLLACLFLTASLAISVRPAAADTIPVILHGKVMMADGSPPPHSVSIQRRCSDVYGDAPGPITDKKGEYIWQMDFDNMVTRACRLEAELTGYASNAIDISDINGFISKTHELPPLILHVKGSDPRTISEGNADVPSAAQPAWKEVVKALQTGNLPAIVEQMKLVVAAAPKFARGWDSLGIAYETMLMTPEARDAYIHATELDPKMTIAFVTLSREDVLAKDWQGAVEAANTAIKLDIKHMYPEVYLHLAVAQYQLNDLNSAEANIRKSLEVNAQERKFRGELVLGQILAAKGDVAGAKEHIAKYLQLSKASPDEDLIKGYLDVIGKPEAAAIHPDLELP